MVAKVAALFCLLFMGSCLVVSSKNNIHLEDAIRIPESNKDPSLMTTMDKEPESAPPVSSTTTSNDSKPAKPAILDASAAETITKATTESKPVIPKAAEAMTTKIVDEGKHGDSPVAPAPGSAPVAPVAPAPGSAPVAPAPGGAPAEPAAPAAQTTAGDKTPLSISETEPADVTAAATAPTTTVNGVSCEMTPFRLDGKCNHATKIDLGSANTPFQSLYEPANIDPNSIDLPSPRLVSNLVSHEDRTPANGRFLSEFFTFFGQFLDHTIAETHGTKTAADIPIPADDKFLPPGGTIAFNRTHKLKNGKWETPENIISSYIDGSAIYGVTDKVAQEIREFKDGYMKLSAGDLLPINNNLHFIAGDVRANENPALQSMHTLWVREHNRVAKEIKKGYPDMKEDKDIFELARLIVVAEFQQVVFHEFVPAILGKKLGKHSGYSASTDGTTSNEFATVAYRVGHTLVNPTLTVYDDHGKVVKKRLSELFFQTSFVRNHNIDGVLLGTLTTNAAEVDVGVTSELRNFLFPDRAGGSGDLVSLNLMRARDHGIPNYNALRQFYGLRKKRSFADITKNGRIAKALHDVYAGDVDKIDPWIGGLAEDHYGKGSLGELFTTAWISEFTRMRDGNRLYYENTYFKEFLPKDVTAKIHTMELLKKELENGGGTMHRILKLNTKIPAKHILANPFFTRPVPTVSKE